MAADSGTMNDQNHHIIIGEEPGWGDPQPFGIAAIDERQHLYIIGKTGTGKTTLLRNLILQHIALGHGVGVIDPHGDLAEELLNHIPPKRADHLVYFNPGDLEFPIGLNVIGSVAPDDWGNLGEEDRKENDNALRTGLRLLSSYRSSGGVTFWIITESNREVTTLLMPDDY